ncbi:coiled-coil domain-containing protein 120-like [Gallus gallus]|uniref:coiled-coil domain-containing protein 120-like n=1 Tax=Gallus gallus TaxID=9031 RepID=UPI001AE360AD|nr:coiled-coil domain-containing protein 120-like [Gallus gallus]
MELRGHILPPGTHSPAGPPPGRLQELRERQRGLRQALGLRLRELRRLCLQEAELTGKLPPEYPLEPGERPQPPPRRRSAAPPRGPLTEAARAARREVAVQLQVVEAARRLASAPGLPPEQRRRRQRLQAEAAQRLRQLRAQLDENGSLCELPGLENGFPPPPKPPLSGAGRPSPPRAPSGSPDRRPLWASDPSTGGPSRRNSLASPASPARTLPRSASSFEGRSVPATPVLARSPHGPPLCRPESSGLPPRPWSGSQDSQLGVPPTGVTSPPQPPPPASSALPAPPRTRRSNSSEALIDWGGATPEPPPEATRGRCAPPSAEQRRSQKWLALEGLRDWYLRHTGGPQNAPPPPPPQPRPQPPAWPPPRRRDPPGLPHSLSYAGALTPRYGGHRGYRAPLF